MSSSMKRRFSASNKFRIAALVALGTSVASLWSGCLVSSTLAELTPDASATSDASSLIFVDAGHVDDVETVVILTEKDEAGLSTDAGKDAADKLTVTDAGDASDQ